MEHQVRPDGVAHEASTSYHRLVTELFVCGTQAADALVPGSIPDWYRERLDLMLAFVRDYTRPDGLAPQIGDADDGRFLPLGDYGADPRDHRHLFAQAGRPLEQAAGSAAYPDGGFFVLRERQPVRDRPLRRRRPPRPAAATATTTSSRSSWPMPAAPLVVDPGTYVYTPDPVERNRFRSTAFHATLRVGGAEQNELRTDDLFAMADRARAEALSWDASSFEGRHHGFPGATHTRRIELGERRAPDPRHGHVARVAGARVDIPARAWRGGADRGRGGWPRVPPRARLVLAELRRPRADDVPARATTFRSGRGHDGDRRQSARLTSDQ